MWYYSNSGVQKGPVDDAELDRLIVTGELDATAYVWKDGMADWVSLRQVRPSVPAIPLAVAEHEGTCSICGNRVGADNLIQLSGLRVCAECKPRAVQSLKEGAALSSIGTASTWQDGKKVVVLDKATLPPRCFKCNKPVTSAPIKRQLYWHHPLIYVLIFISLIIYVIVAVIVRKRASVNIHVCEEHMARRRMFMMIGWFGSLFGLCTIITGTVMNHLWIILTGVVLFIAALITGLIGAPISRTARIKDGKAWLLGAHKDFIASLPQWLG